MHYEYATVASKKLMEQFIRMVNKYNALKKHPISYGNKETFFHSERHMLDIFGDNPDNNVTELAQMIGVTKGAISQVVAKLEKKGAIRRFKDDGNAKEIRIELTAKGREIYRHHKRTNNETILHVQNVLKKYPDDRVESFMEMFQSLESYLDSSRKQMHQHREKPL